MQLVAASKMRRAQDSVLASRPFEQKLRSVLNELAPYADVELSPLLRRTEPVRRIAVLCPAFVADCLETVEEIAIRAARDWRAHGGEELRLVPSLNAHPAWVRAAAALARRAAQSGLGARPIHDWTCFSLATGLQTSHGLGSDPKS